jgi:hypothetical protein
MAYKNVTKRINSIIVLADACKYFVIEVMWRLRAAIQNEINLIMDIDCMKIISASNIAIAS